MKKFMFLAAMLFAAFTTASAQEDQVIEEFQPHWFLQLQGGGAYTLGEAKFKDLLSPAAQVAVGYQFNPVLGLRLQGSGWESKGGWVSHPKVDYKWNYASAGLDLKVSLTNLIGGWKPKRFLNMGLILGGAANIAWNNDEAQDLQAVLADMPPVFDKDGYTHELEYLWDGTKVRPVGRVGLDFDFRCSDRVAITLEGNANVISDKYNSKKAEKKMKADWYFNALLGVKVALGPTVKRTIIPAPVIEEPAPVVEEPKPVVKPEPVKKPEMRTEIFYAIRETVAVGTEAAKLENLIAFLKANPETKVSVTSYADAGTGNPKINQMYASKRAENVAKALTEAGIDAARITVDSKGDTVQPFAENDKNRVSIAIAK
ncbi:MAG: OmpA family protein [Bacteroidaceae bacterium]|nr:OmpA family protein [Bacteroidaceae bacterium]